MKIQKISKAVFVGLLSSLVVSQVALADVTGTLIPFHDGGLRQLNPSQLGARRVSMVDEQQCNGRTDYNFTNVVGAKDSYMVDLRSVPNGAIVYGIEIIPCASAHQNGNIASVMNVFHRFNGNMSRLMGNYALNGFEPAVLPSTEFMGLSLVKSSNSVLEVGAVLSAGNRGMRLSHMAVRVHYSPMPAPTNVTGLSNGNQVIVMWSDNAKTEQGFRVERLNPARENDFSVIGVVDTNSQTYTDINLVPGTYVYRVSAINSGSTSEPAFGTVTVQ